MFAVGEEQLRLRAVVGFADLAQRFDDPGHALSAAEEALRAARGHVHGIAAWERPVPVEDQALAALAQELRDALASGGLQTAFQPIVAVAGGNEAQFQVLLRMRDSQGIEHAAGQVLAAAARIGATIDVDRRVMEIAIGALRRQKLENRALRLFVTQAPTTLAHQGHAQWLLQSLAEAGVDGGSLVVDVRQEDALVHALSLQEFCREMVAGGVQLCLSQYSYGPEANALLGQLPLGYVRLAALLEPAARAGGARRDAQRDRPRAPARAAGDRPAGGGRAVGRDAVDDRGRLHQGNLVQRPAGELEFDFHNSVL